MRHDIGVIFHIVILFLLGMATSGAEIRGVIDTSVALGGNNLVDLTYDDGSLAFIKAGDGITMVGGIIISLFETATTLVDIETTLGWQYNIVSQTNDADASWTRWPWMTKIAYTLKPWHMRIGLGVDYQFNNELKGTGIANVISATYDNALGYVAQLDYLFNPRLALYLRYVSIAYQLKNSETRVKGNSWGVGGRVSF